MSARKNALSEIQRVLKRDIKTLRDAVTKFDSSKGCMGASICTGRKADGSLLRSNNRRLCDYAMQAIITKFSAGKDSSVKPITKINMCVENYLADAVCFTSRIEREIALVCGDDHKNCTPFTSNLPSQGKLKLLILSAWWRENGPAFEAQARVSGLEKGEDRDDNEDQEAASPDSAARKRSRDEFEAAASA